MNNSIYNTYNEYILYIRKYCISAIKICEGIETNTAF